MDEMSENIKKLAREAGGKKVAEWLPEHGGDGKRGFCCHGAPDHEVWCENYPMEAP